MIVLGAVLALSGIYALVIWSKAPNELVVLCDNKIIFNGRQFMIADIADVKYERARNRYGMRAKFGKLEVILKSGKSIKCSFIDDVENVHSKFLRLMVQYNNRDN